MWLSKSDLHYTLRRMGKKPGFVLLAALVLAGGLSVCLIAFTITYSLGTKPIPVTNGERIVRICSLQICEPMMADDFARIREDITSLSNVGAYMERNGTRIEYNGEIWQLPAIMTEWNLFQLSESQAALGRTLQAEDHAAGAEAVAVLGHRLWQQRFGGDPTLVGRSISINGEPVRVVGVMPEGYAMPYSGQLWLPISSQVLEPVDGMLATAPLVESFALLNPGVSVEQASAEIAALMARNRAQHPRDPFAQYPSRYLQFVSNIATGHVAHFPLSMLGGGVPIIIFGLMNGLTLLVFLLACINVGTLLLSRINERTKDTAICVALGASRRRLLVQTCLEGTFITVLGAVLAVLLAGMGLEFLKLVARSLGEGLLAFWMDFRIDASILLGVVFYVVLSILLTSVIPAWRIINGDFSAAMQDGTRGALGLRPGRFSRSLVVCALMIVTLLLYLASLLGSAVLATTRNLDEISENLVSAGFTLDATRYDEARREEFLRTLLTRLEGGPGIENAAIVANLGRGRFEGEDVVAAPMDRREASLFSGSLNTQGFADGATPPLLEGRRITEADSASSEYVLNISQSLANQLWPGESPVDKRLRIVGHADVSDEWRRVVGLLADSDNASFLTDTRLELAVFPLAQVSTSVPLNLSVMASLPTVKPGVMQYLRETFAELDNGVEVQVFDPATRIGNISNAFGMGVRLVVAIGAFVFLIAIAGIYGLTQNAVLLARHEIGVRRALGARDSLIARLFMKRSGKQVAMGFVAAMLLCAPVTLLFSMLAQEFQLDTGFSLAVSAVAIIILYAVVMLATYLPVRKILRLEPSEALRYE